MSPITKYALINALLTTLYVSLVATFLFYASKIFGKAEDFALIPIAMLMLFVLSATICGILVFGKPVMWYLDGKKKEAVSLLIGTVAFLLIAVLLAFTGVYFLSQ